MTKLKTLLVAMLASITLYAGGDIAPVEPAVEVPVVQNTKDFYVGGSIIAGESITSDKFKTFETTGVGIDAGYVFYRNGDFSAAVEGRYNTLFSSIDDFGDVYTIAGFLKPQYNVCDVGVYGLFGYSNVDNGKDEADGFAYGIGASYALNEDFDVFADYVVNDNSDLDGLQDGDFNKEIVSVGVNYKF